MSSRSPRGSLSGAPTSDEVAEDFAESLKDLQINNRYEITNLTVIAKENTEHAQAISRALEHHIKTTAPSRKLPALYVLDSVVKNVGTPYTGYLGANLFSTFMEAYTLVDPATRRSMEGVLKTWKEPITGSIDPRPVFPPETVRPIENALIKAKTMALQNQRHLPQQVPYRDTPTPPQHHAFGIPAIGQGHQQPFSLQLSTPNQQQPGFHYPQPQQQPIHEVDAIRRDLAVVLARSRELFTENPYDSSQHARLQALLQLESILNSRALSAVELENVRNQLSAMSTGSSLAAARPTPPPQSSRSQWHPPPVLEVLPPHLAGPPQPYPQTSSTQPAQPVPVIPPGALSSLQALFANNQKPGTPQMRAAAPVLHNASHAQLQNVQNQTAAAPALNGVDLVAALSKNGITPSLPQSQPSAGPAGPAALPNLSTADLLRSLQGKITPLKPPSNVPSQPIAAANAATTSSASQRPRIPMNSAALKTFHPALVYALYESHPNQCSTCGRRFAATEAGRQKKTLHMDWHFRTAQRAADARGGGPSGPAHRLFYLDEYPWVQHRDFDVSTTSAAVADGSGVGSGSEGDAGRRPKRPEDESVPAPPGITKVTCRICLESMKAAFNEARQAWVFMNAKKSGGAIVHATCWAELQKAEGGGMGGKSGALSMLSGASAERQRSATPEPVGAGGKRKAEAALLNGSGARIKTA